MPYHRFQLSNGLSIMLISQEHFRTVEVALFVKAGPRFEGRKTAGISHFVEHMLFRGTHNVADLMDLHERIESLGGPIQALTARDFCQYSLTLPSAHLAAGLELLAHIVFHPTFDQIEVERQILLEELLGDQNALGNDVNPDNHCRPLLWSDNALGMNIAGTEANVRRFQTADLLEHHQRHYVATNCTLVIAGTLPPSFHPDQLDTLFASLHPGTSLHADCTPPMFDGPLLRFVATPDSQDYLLLSLLAVPFLDPDYVALTMLHTLLAEGITSRLQWQICEQSGLAYELDADLECYYDVGALDIRTAVAPGKLPAVLRKILKILADLRNTRLTERELLKLQARCRFGTDLLQDAPSDLASWLGPRELYVPVADPDAALDRWKPVTAEDLQRVAIRVFTPKNMVAIVLGRASRQDRQLISRILHGDWLSGN